MKGETIINNSVNRAGGHKKMYRQVDFIGKIDMTYSGKN